MSRKIESYFVYHLDQQLIITRLVPSARLSPTSLPLSSTGLVSGVDLISGNEGSMERKEKRRSRREHSSDSLDGEEAYRFPHNHRQKQDNDDVDREENGGGVLSSVNLDALIGDPPEPYRDDEVEPHAELSRHQRSSMQEDVMRQLRTKIRHSLDGTSSPQHWFGITKENFFRQRLPVVWRPIWNCYSVGRLLLVLAIVTLPLALYLFFAQLNVHEFRFTFGEECKNSRNYLRMIRSLCVFCGGNLNPHCSKLIVIPEDMKTPVYIYYEIENFHQNHRMVAKSFDNEQLMGRIFGEDGKPVQPSANCGKYSHDKDGKIYFPCGLLPDLMFTDDFALVTDKGHEVPLRAHGIAMPVLKYYRYRNPDEITPKDYHLKSIFTQHFVKPRDWSLQTWDQWWKDGGMENERFINWMNPSAFSSFRKLYAVIDSVPECPPGLFCKGNYTMNIEYRYDIEKFHANKAFVLASASLLGGLNFNMPLLVGIVGCVELALGLVMVQVDKLAREFEYDVEHLHRHHRHGSRRSRSSQRSAASGDSATRSRSNMSTFAVTCDYVVSRSPNNGEPPSEGVRGNQRHYVNEEVSTLYYRNPTIEERESRVVYPDGVTTDDEGEEEEESDASNKSTVVSAAGSSAPEEDEDTNVAPPDNQLRKRQ